MMKICITAKGVTPAAMVEERFGRAPYFIIMERENRTFEAIKNPFAAEAGGVGPRVAQLLISHKVDALVSGLVGGNVQAVLTAAGIDMYTYKAGGSVMDAFEQCKKGTLEEAA
jgi:predicted Fe-Mo cluster-binding NifX family protein